MTEPTRTPVAITRLVLVVAFGALIAPAVSAGADRGPRFPNGLFRDRNTVDRLAPTEIGPSYACAVVAGERRSRRRLLIYATSDNGVKRAKELRQQLRHPRRTEVRHTARRYRATTMERTRALVIGSQPHGPEPAAIALESPLGRSRCPRVEITLLPKGEASPELERWAKDTRDRYGTDRIVIRRAELTLHTRVAARCRHIGKTAGKTHRIRRTATRCAVLSDSARGAWRRHFVAL